MEEISATIGIDMSTATPEQVGKRAYEFALEMADCYTPGTIEYSAFEALSIAISLIRGGK